MLYKKIHLTKTHDTCLAGDKEYIYSVETFLTQQDQIARLYVELDNIFNYIGLDNAYHSLLKQVRSLSLGCVKRRLIDKEKTFIDHDDLAMALLELDMYLQNQGVTNPKLREVIGNLQYIVSTDWHLEARKIINACVNLNLFYKAEKCETHEQIDDIASLIKLLIR